MTIKNLRGGSFPAHSVTFNAIAVAGTGFRLTSNGSPPSPATLAAGATCRVKILFAPDARGAFRTACQSLTMGRKPAEDTVVDRDWRLAESGAIPVDL